jgi:hypothetical protein
MSTLFQRGVKLRGANSTPRRVLHWHGHACRQAPFSVGMHVGFAVNFCGPKFVHVHVRHASMCSFVHLFVTRRGSTRHWVFSKHAQLQYYPPESCAPPGHQESSASKNDTSCTLGFLVMCPKIQSRSTGGGTIGHERRLTCSVSTLERGAMDGL